MVKAKRELILALLRAEPRIYSQVLLILLVACSVAFAENVRVDSAEIQWHKYYDNIFIETSDYVIPTVKQTHDRIILQFKNAEAGNFRAALAKSPRIKVVYPTLGGKDTVLVVIELKKPVKYEIASIFGKGQVIVEIAEVSMGKLAYKEEEKERPREVIKAEVLPPIKAEKQSKEGILKGKLIVVDPGHGGEDPGAFGFSGIQEKNLTLSTALYLANSLRRSGASVLMTRKKDVKRDLPDIVDFVNRSKADIYVGVHYNSIIGRSVSGTETYYCTQQSFRLAACVHKEMLKNLRRQDRGLKRAKFYTIHHSNVPAVLVEPVYITDMQEGVLAQSKAFQKEVAESITQGIKDYFSR